MCFFTREKKPKKNWADIISASCIIFGVDIAIHKLRSYISNCSSVNIPNNHTILVYRGDWVAQTVQLQVSTRQDALVLKYLRIQNILNSTSTTQLDIRSTGTQS